MSSPAPAPRPISQPTTHKKKNSGEAQPISLDDSGSGGGGLGSAANDNYDHLTPGNLLPSHRRDDSSGMLIPSDNAQDYEEDDHEYTAASAVVAAHSPAASNSAAAYPHGNNTRTSFVSAPTSTQKTLNSLTLFAILYAACVGGGYGFEDAVGHAGPLVVTLFCLIMPWLWCMPTALAVSELSSAMPTNAGFLAWSQMTFHPVVTHFNAMCTIVITLVSNAVYPALFAHYVKQFFGGSSQAASSAGMWSASVDSVNSDPVTTHSVEPAAKLFAVAVSVIVNIFGSHIVGYFSLLLGAVATYPFIILVIFQFTSASWRKLVAGTQSGFDFNTIAYLPDLSRINWTGFLSIATWNYAGYDAAGSVVEEVTNPQKALPRAFFPLMLSSYVSYLLPVWAGVSVFSAGREQHWSRWTSGYWTEVSYWVGGVKLQDWMRFGGLFVSLGYLTTYLCSTSRTVAGIGQIGALPRPVSKLLSYHSLRFGTPVAATLIVGVCSLILSLLFTFQDLVALTQVLYMIRLLMIYASLILLRKQEPALRRPFCIPLSTQHLTYLMAPSIVFCVVVLCLIAFHSGATLLLTFLFIPAVFGFSYFYVNNVGFSGSMFSVLREGADAEECCGGDAVAMSDRAERDRLAAGTLADVAAGGATAADKTVVV